MSLLGKLTSGITKKTPVDKISSEAADMLKKNKDLLNKTLDATINGLAEIPASKLSAEDAMKVLSDQVKAMMK